MVRGFSRGFWIGGVVLLIMSGCTTAPVSRPPDAAFHLSKAPVKPCRENFSTVRRAITAKELRKLSDKDPDLDFSRCTEILCRLNKKDKEYILRDVKLHRPLIVPRNFSSYKDWSPLPGYIPGARTFPRFILIVKNIPFLGWYENGRRVGDTYVGIGKMKAWTKKGFYWVDKKDPFHWSTYSDAYGEPAIMPDALHIYARVWIHTGDVIGPYCSHGCINVPMGQSGTLWDWATVGTPVLVTRSLKDLPRDIRAAHPGKLKKSRSAKKKGEKGKHLKPVNRTPEQRQSLKTATEQ